MLCGTSRRAGRHGFILPQRAHPCLKLAGAGRTQRNEQSRTGLSQKSSFLAILNIAEPLFPIFSPFSCQGFPALKALLGKDLQDTQRGIFIYCSIPLPSVKRFIVKISRISQKNEISLASRQKLLIMIKRIYS